MSPTTNNKIPLLIANWLSKNWLKALSGAISFTLFVAASSFWLGKFYEQLNSEYDKIKIEQGCSDRLNQEIDKNRALQDQITKDRVDNLYQAVNSFKLKSK